MEVNRDFGASFRTMLLAAIRKRYDNRVPGTSNVAVEATAPQKGHDALQQQRCLARAGVTIQHTNPRSTQQLRDEICLGWARLKPPRDRRPIRCNEMLHDSCYWLRGRTPFEQTC